MSTDHGELRPAYRTLNDPARLLGLPVSALAGLIVAGLAGYAFLRVSPLPFKLNVSLVVTLIGAPTAILALRDASTIGPGRLLAGALAWRARPARVTCTLGLPVRRGGVRLTAITEPVGEFVDADVPVELPWTQDDPADTTGREAA